MFKELKERIETYLNNQQTEQNEKIKHEFIEIFQVIENLESNTNQNISENLIIRIKFLLINDTLSNLIQIGLTNEYCSFVSDIVFCIFNLNNNIWKDKEIETICLTIKYIIQCRDVLGKTNKVVLQASEKMKDLQNWYPPSFDISKKYLDLLLNN